MLISARENYFSLAWVEVSHTFCFMKGKMRELVIRHGVRNISWFESFRNKLDQQIVRTPFGDSLPNMLILAGFSLVL